MNNWVHSLINKLIFTTFTDYVNEILLKETSLYNTKYMTNSAVILSKKIFSFLKLSQIVQLYLSYSKYGLLCVSFKNNSK
jgi:hypothetical protein